MFEGIKIIKTLKKLVNDTSSIPANLVSESEHLAKQKLYSIEEVSVMIVQAALQLKYINRASLTPKGEALVSEVEKEEAKLDY